MSTEQQLGVDRLREVLHRVELAGQYQRAARARQTGERQVELSALEHLAALGGLTPGELADRVGLTSGGMTALAARLIDAGYVSPAPHPHDRRMKLLTITPAGAAHVAHHIGPVLAPADGLLESVSADEAVLLARFLDSLADLKEHAAAAATPGPPPTSEPYSHALLM